MKLGALGQLRIFTVNMRVLSIRASHFCQSISEKKGSGRLQKDHKKGTTPGEGCRIRLIEIHCLKVIADW